MNGSEFSEHSESAEKLVGGLRAPVLFDSSTPSACGGRGYWVVGDRGARAPDVADGADWSDDSRMERMWLM